MEEFIEKSISVIKNNPKFLSHEEKENFEKEIVKIVDSIVRRVEEELKNSPEYQEIRNQIEDLQYILRWDSDARIYFTQDIESNFGSESIKVGSYYNEEAHKNAIKLVEEWPEKRENLLKRKEKVEKMLLPKFLKNLMIENIDAKIRTNDRKYNYYKGIFDREEEVKAIGKEKLEKDLEHFKALAQSIAQEVCDKFIAEELNNNPNIVLIREIETAMLTSNEFNCKLVYFRLEEILKNYRYMQKEIEK